MKYHSTLILIKKRISRSTHEWRNTAVCHARPINTIDHYHRTSACGAPMINFSDEFPMVCGIGNRVMSFLFVNTTLWSCTSPSIRIGGEREGITAEALHLNLQLLHLAFWQFTTLEDQAFKITMERCFSEFNGCDAFPE